MAEPITIGVFASERGPGDAERASIMSQVGKYLAGKGARLVCITDGGAVPVPLIAAARLAGGPVTIVADLAFRPPSALAGVDVERLSDEESRLRRLASLAGVFVALPGSFSSAAGLFRSWVRAGGGEGDKPVVFFNRNGAFEVIRGFAADVLSPSVRHHDRYIQFADSPEDLWNKISWLLNEGAAARQAAGR
jgi:predicted Rossmann-fold nucleotide-binding protein